MYAICYILYIRNFILYDEDSDTSLFYSRKKYSVVLYSTFAICKFVRASSHIVFTLVLSYKILRGGLWFSLLEFFANKVIRINRQRHEQMATDRDVVETRWDR